MSSFAPTQQELALVNQVFVAADPSKLGIITGDAAVKVFAGAKLAPTALGEIWSISDKDNNGFLTKKGVAIALRLIGHAQKGEPVKESLLDRPGPLAFIEGISPSKRPSSILSSPPNSPPPRGSLFPPLTAEDKTKFLRLFLGCGPVNGLLSGDKARDVFIKSKLPFEKLSQVWALADTQDRGSLDQTDFTVAMYLIQAVMSGQMTNLPATLPPGLYEQAGGRAPASVATHSTGNSVTLSPSLTGSFTSAVSTPAPLTAQTTGGARTRLQPQTTGQEYSRLSMVVSPQQHVHFALGASAFGGAPMQQWDVTHEEKTRFDQFFDGLDTQKRNFIEGDVAVPFMLQSKLSEDILAQVWDLADLNNDGRLTRDGFAVAMHLIQGKLAGKEIPSTLPISLIPPSMRANRLAATAPSVAPAPASVPEPIRDLLWDDSPPASATAPQHPNVPSSQPSSIQQAPVLQPQGTGYNSQQHTGVFGARSSAAPALHTDPFGTSTFAAAVKPDLLSDDEGTTPTSVPDNSAEIGNLKNQISSTNRSLDTTTTERQNTETAIATQASQLTALQTQLLSAKAAYETETRLLTSLRERFAAQSTDIQKLREELIRAESDLSAVRVEKAEIEGSLLRDKEEVRDLQRKMKGVGEEMDQIKVDLEKARKQTKHQKGLLAIAKKQLATREAESAKIAKELEGAEDEAREATRERESADEDLAKGVSPAKTNGFASSTSIVSEPSRMDTPSFAAAQPLPASPMTPPMSVTSPSSTKTNNPFERLVMASSGSRPASPFSAPAADLFFVPTPQLRTETPQTEMSSPTGVNVPSTATVFDVNSPHASSPFVFATEPSTSTSAPSTHSATATDADDPFGLTEGDNMSSTTSVAVTPEKPATPQPAAAPELEVLKDLSPSVAEVASPDITSLTAEEASPELDIAAAQFPSIDSHVVSGTTGFDEGSTALDAKLVEKEVEESDSDSDIEDEFHDAKEARMSTSSPVNKPTVPSGVLSEREAGTSSNGIDAQFASPVAFDDVFELGSSTPKADAPAGSDLSSNFFSMPTPQPTEKELANGKATAASLLDPPAGVNAFDEAMGKISSPSISSAAPHFKLDSGFDDNFDFSAAKTELGPSPSLFPPLSSSSAPAVNGSQDFTKAPFDINSPFAPAVQGKAQENGNAFSFDDAFGSVAPSHISPQPPAGDHGISFEDAFDGGANNALAFDGAFGIPAAAPSGPVEPKTSDTKAAPFPSQSPSRSPSLGATPASPSTTRSFRSTSPPPRTSSPKPRISTGSSGEGATSNKSPPPARHSKLSIRLPFGRKDKKKSKHDPPPVPPPQFLSPVAEPGPGGLSTPAVEDDVEPVKQLCGMGFSRSQAVVALEKHGYDVQRALNSLLGGT
ncbi:hypothetical protein M0805_003880 [Coniferiporia weirii]|nr:hypothetical protein M0805_003880 [Coniferiporia weirii]